MLYIENFQFPNEDRGVYNNMDYIDLAKVIVSDIENYYSSQSLVEK